MSYENKEEQKVVDRFKSIFIAGDSVLNDSSINVFNHAAKALANATDLIKVLTKADIKPMLPKLPDTASLFLYDYLTAINQKESKIDLAFFVGLPFGVTMDVLRPAKTIVDVSMGNIELSKEEYEKRNGLGSYPFDYLVDSSLWSIYSRHIQNADVVLCPSKLSASYISRKLSLKHSMAVIPYGCSLPEENSIQLPAEFTVTHVGANTPDKGQIYLVKAWSKLQQNPKFAGQIAMVGQGTSMWLPFGALAWEHEDHQKLYNDCSVYVQPSVTEGFGGPVLEAMAYARPVIVTEGAGVHELVTDGKDGFVVPIRDVYAVKEKIQYFHDNPCEVKRMGKNAREKAKQYTWEKIEAKYQKLIKSIL